MPVSRTTRARERIRGIALLLIFDIVGPLFAYSQLKKHGATDVTALIVSGVLPVLGIAIKFAAHRRIDAIGVLVLVGIIIAVALGVWTDDPKLILLEGAIPTGLFALACLFSLPMRKPLMYRFAEAGMGGSETAAAQEFGDQYAAQPGMRHFFRVVTAVWGVAFAIEAAVKVYVTQTASTGEALTFSRIAPYPLIVVLLVWMFAYSRRLRRSNQIVR